MSWIGKKCWIPVLLAVMFLSPRATAAEPVPCFAPGTFSGEEIPEGIWITSVPATGQITLGNRIIRPGDVIPADRLEELAYHGQVEGSPARMGYIPVYSGGPGAEAAVVFSRKGTNKPPPGA